VTLTDDVKAVEKIRRDVGMVFRQFNLLPHLAALENLMPAPHRVLGLQRAEAEERTLQQLTRVHIAEQAHKYPGQRSGRAAAGGDRPRAVHAAAGAAEQDTALASPGPDMDCAVHGEPMRARQDPAWKPWFGRRHGIRVERA